MAENYACISEGVPVGFCQQSSHRTRLVVAVCADYHEFAFGEALTLEPRLAATRPIGSQCVL